MKALSLSEFIIDTDRAKQGALLDFLGLPEENKKTNIRIYTEHLNQPFTPEMIIEKFKGWEYNGKIYHHLTQNHKIIIGKMGIIELNGSWYPIPKTLEDFMKFCSYAEIELEFK